jgi:hypothetical protein
MYIAANPIQAEKFLMEEDDENSEAGKYLNFPHMDNAMRHSKLYLAKQAAREVRTQTANSFFDQRAAFLNGESTQDVNPADVLAAVANGSAKRSEVAPYLKAPKEKFDPVEANSLMTEINGTDFSAANGGILKTTLQGKIAGVAAGNTEALANLRKRLEQKTDPASAINTPVGKRMEQDIEHAFKTGGYGEFESKLMLGPGEFKTVINRKAEAEAQAHQRAAIDFITHELMKNPDMTNVEAGKLLAKFNEPFTLKAVSKSIDPVILGVPPLSTTTKETQSKESRLRALLGR